MSVRSKIGVDTGGTFTDFVWLEDGRLHIHKQLSSPDDPSRAVLAGVRAANVSEAAQVVHGSTVATNALLERRGARTALITTEGFADVLAIGRQNRPDLYALTPQKPPPLVPRAWRFEVPERVTAQGEALRPLEPEALDPIVEALAAEEVESVAVCLLFSFLYPQHEQAIRERLLEAAERDERLRNLHISLSCEILPEYREYERTATTVINAYVTPLMGRYLSRVSRGIAPRSLAVMQSNGGVISVETAGTEAARTVLSGPAGGVVGAHFIAERAGFQQIITFDMGGTSSDVALCPGLIPTTSEGEIAGLPLRLPAIDIHTVGAGGGSLAYLDAGGALHVGPQSAGADPGPVSYGLQLSEGRRQRVADEAVRDGLYVTTTDANLVLGRLDEGNFLGGTMRLYGERALAAMEGLAREMGAPSAQKAAWDVLQVANATMERAIRRISVERGFDPREFTLVAFGGAGPLHACDLAQSMQIPRVLVPPVPGVLSALGMLVAAPAKDYSQTVMQRLVDEGEGDSRDVLDDAFKLLRQRAQEEMAGEGHETAQLTWHYSLDMRYAGQSHELEVAYEPGHTTTVVISNFHAAHEQRYGYSRREAPVEVVNVRLVALAPATPPQLPRQEERTGDGQAARCGEKQVWFNEKPYATPLYQREKLAAGDRFQGPAVIFQYDTTTVVPPAWGVRVDGFGNLVVESGD